MQAIFPVWLFYLAEMCGSIKEVLSVGGCMIGGIGGVILAIVFIILLLDGDLNDSEGFWNTHLKKKCKIVIFAFALAFLSCFIPSKSTIYTMMVASQITPQNIELVNGEVKDTVDYIFEKVDKCIDKQEDKDDKKK
jgi:hypothetical protein